MIDTRPLSEITQEAISILLREIGVINTVRFLNQFTGGYGNYTKDRPEMFGRLTVDEIVTAIEKDRVKPKP